MNFFILCAFPLLPLFGILLFLRKLSGLYPWEICRSFPDLLVLPFVFAYLLMLLAAGWLARCADLWGPPRAHDASTRHSPPRTFPSGATTSPN